MSNFSTKKLHTENCENYYCENCDYYAAKKSSWDKHLKTKKHGFNNVEKVVNDTIKCPNCNKKYKDRSGLWYHLKKCSNIIYNIEQDISNNVILEIVKQNQEFKELIIEQNKQMLEQNKENQELQKKLLEMAKEGKTINNTTTNNTKFNLQLFLNEQCKDALNIMDFVNSLTLKLTDLENIGKLGYSEGISKIFINGLKQLDVFKRPIHCSDLKRETLYVKDENSWEKENDGKAKIKQAIKRIANKNIKQIPEWQKEHPQSQDTTSKKHEEYMKIVGESMGGLNVEEDEKNYNKIIKNVAKEVMIDK